MEHAIRHHRLANGLTILAEPMPWLKSAAFALHLPAGTWREPDGKEGLAAITIDMTQRGAGKRSTRDIIEQLDLLGVDSDESVSTYHSSFSATMMAEVLPDALAIFADIVRDPHLPESGLESTRKAALQELHGLEDELSQRCFRELKSVRYDGVFGRSAQGTFPGLESITLDDVRDFHQKCYDPAATILAIAGSFEWESLVKRIEELFGGWEPRSAPELPSVRVRRTKRFLQHPSQQTHIALAYDGVPYGDPGYYQSRGLIGVLSDGMSSRLFTEVREKRGLVYSVFAVPHSLRGVGSVLCYAGTTTPRAQETLDVMMGTILELADGVKEDEVRRLKARVKSSLVMEQESSAGRAAQIASDWFYLGRVVMMDEVKAEIDRLTSESLRNFFVEHLPKQVTLVTLGEQQLELPSGVSAPDIG